MASRDIKNPVGVNNPADTRRSSDLLPGYLRTDKNTKFLASTLDQLIQQPQLERIGGFMGSRLSPNYDPTKDNYIDSGSKLRNAYQLEPGLIVKDSQKNITMSLGYDDLINELENNNAGVSNLSNLFQPSSYSYDPKIDWDKFVNYREYYWMPTGPDTIEITGAQKSTVSTYTVKDSADGLGLMFTPDGLTATPLLTLYRGLTYVFDVDSAYPFYIKIAYAQGRQDLYTGAANNGIKKGQVIVTIDETTPALLFYFAEGNPDAVGQIVVKALAEDTAIDIDSEIIGKQTYTSGNGVKFSNGMKVRFIGTVTPDTYQDKEYFVEGVGTAIVLIDYDSLTNIGTGTTNLDVNFDATPFDEYPFDDFQYVPLTPEYITSNRASLDKNSWARYNRWVHSSVLEATATANKVPVVYPGDKRAQRPIVEFAAGLQLYNFGTTAKQYVDLIDNTTTDAFGIVEKSAGYHIDGVLIEPGYRVIFNADADPLVRGKIYNVNFVIVNGQSIVDLEEAVDSIPELNNAVLAVRGEKYKGTNWWFDGTTWIFGQQKTAINQMPVFELYDNQGNRYSDQNIYESTFKGTRLFNYVVGTGTADPVLGFPLKYRNVSNVGEYLFNNYYMTDTFNNFVNGNVEIVNVSNGYLKLNDTFINVWTKTVDRQIPIIQYQVLSADIYYIQIDAIDNPGTTNDLTIEIFVNDVKQVKYVDYIINLDGPRAYVVSTSTFKANDRILVNLYTASPANANGYYAPPINLTNNPLNGPITDFSFTELSDHAVTMSNNNSLFTGKFPGSNNFRDLGNIAAYGSRLVSHNNPISFAHYFLGTKEHNIIDAIRKVSTDYNQFKTNLIKHVTDLRGTYTPGKSLDTALLALNATKDSTSAYSYSDMLAHGGTNVTRTFTVTDSRNVRYSLASVFDDTVLSERAVLVYLNGNLLTKNYDYTISKYDSNITMLIALAKNDVITVVDYVSTIRSYVPPTPTKLGLYPKFKPAIFVDNTYVAGPQTVIQGHDGSIMIAFNDYRDAVILEYETRIYNNLKIEYNPELLNIADATPGAFRSTGNNQTEFTNLLSPDFLRWAGFFGVDYQTNSVYDENNSNTYETNSFTYNYTGSVNRLNRTTMSGFWRGVYKYYFDTDRPHTHPWEMLGFSEQPSWWTTVYGPAPYTAGNGILWSDLEAGRVAQGSRQGIDLHYARPGLSKIIPVDTSGNLLSPIAASFTDATNIKLPPDVGSWQFGDQAPAETAWRRSSYWPFACQVALALSKPATYSSLCFDTSRMHKNIAGQYRYGSNNIFLNPSSVSLFRDTVNESRVLATGYSVWIIETGIARNADYIAGLKTDLANLNYNLMLKLGGFASKDKLQVSIDAVDPTSAYPGVLIPSEDYSIFYNQSSPIESLNISGLIIQKTATGWAVRGYDKFRPYFTIFKPFASNVDQALTVGGQSAPYTIWKENTTYNIGDIVFYNDRYYRVLSKHNSDVAFTKTYYQSLPYLPTIGGVTVLRRTNFDIVETVVPYGVEYSTIQEVYDHIVGYGQWIASIGFVFDEFNNDLEQVLDWNYTAREFMYWTTQNWAVNSVITLSPFANKLTLQSNRGVVDSVVSNFYEYSLLKADGSPFPPTNFSLVRLDGEFVLSTVNTTEGIFFARLDLVQKEHVVVMNNFTLFNDVVYDIESGYRQRRVNLKGFRTANWNGDFFSPGFIFDQATIQDWEKYADYSVGDTVRFSGKYYSALTAVTGTETFDITKWATLQDKPTPALLPNFDYKINQFEDFYSLDIDNFDIGQQAMAQHLTGYTPRPYLNYIIGDPIAQYKFYQGFIRDKGSKNSLTNLSKASLNNFQTTTDFNEEWAFRIGYYGGYNTYQELETNLESTKFLENPQIIEFVFNKPSDTTDTVYYKDETDLIIKPDDFDITTVFATSTSVDTLFQLPVAGYVRLDDITATVYNKNSVLDIANVRALSEGTTLWLGFREDGEWDVLRVTQQPTLISNVVINVAYQSLTVTTSLPHQLVANDLISITGVDPAVDKCYVVSEIISSTEFVVASTLAVLPTLATPLTGLLFAFKSSRIKTSDDMVSIPSLERWNYGEKLWIDDADGSGNWAVYKKINNYSQSSLSGFVKTGQNFGAKIATGATSNLILSSSPDYVDAFNNYGLVYILYRNTLSDTPEVYNEYTVNDTNTYYQGQGYTKLGSSLILDSVNNLAIAGAPATSRVHSTASNHVVFSSITGNNFAEQGVVKLSLLNEFQNFSERGTTGRQVITTPNPQANAQFGTSVAYSTATQTLLVGAPGESTNNGTVYLFNITINSSGTAVTASSPIAISTALSTLFGSAISGNLDLSRFAVTAPDTVNAVTSGTVYVYSGTSILQEITSADLAASIPMTNNDKFGESVTMTPDGAYLFIGSPAAFDIERGIRSGVVDVFAFVGSQYQWNQRIHAPIISHDINFGHAISVNPESDSLVISSLGNGITSTTTFDTYSQRSNTGTYVNDSASLPRGTVTTFDGKSTGFNSKLTGIGAVHNYVLKGSHWIHAQELAVNDLVADINYGQSVFINDGSIFVGAPGYSTSTGKLYVFDKIDTTTNSWQTFRHQEALVDLAPIKRAISIDTTTEQIQDYIEIIDPIKGKILGTAKEELKYISPYDPALYSIGINGTNVNTNNNWLDEHVGDLWWDLSTVKYVWYEQGELEYRKNNWNNTFPGSSIDVYEWVRSQYLPSDWSQLADTTAGATQGISGQPKFVDNSVISVKQVYNGVSNSFSNVYYYWVKNKTIVPAGIPDRKKPVYEIANQIADPVGSGLEFLAVISPTAAMLANYKPAIQTDAVNLNIGFDTITDAANRHTEWLLLQENDANSRPNALLEKKLIDSLLGHDSLGNPVPDPALPKKLSYGVGIRPRQSLFVDRSEALRNIIEYANTTLAQYRFTDIIDFTNLNAKDEIPLASTYDSIVETTEILKLTQTSNLSTAQLEAIIDSNGGISGAIVTNGGFGYLTSPTITISGTGAGAELTATLDEKGKIVGVTVIKTGTGYSALTTLTVRPFTVVVQSDTTSNGKWASYEWDGARWIKTRTQSYDTTQYWKYVDWASTDYNPLTIISATVPSVYSLQVLYTLSVGSYVRVQNGGAGRYLTLSKTDGTGGTFDTEWNIVYAEKGTIQFLDAVWSTSNTQYAWDEIVGFDVTEYDQTPDIEIGYIVTALKDDIFVGLYKAYWNKLFFKAVRYAMSEQKFLDWAFKTTFISVVNNAGTLDQRHTYKLQNGSYYEDFLNEIKPYHTKIRQFTETYASTELTNSFNTDFDLPTYFNTATLNFNKVEFGNTLLLQYPWKSWYNNYAYGIASINVVDGGSGYTSTPTVSIIPVSGDTGTGATAVAYIALGKITSIVVTNPGKGYTATPTVVINGGGGTATALARAYAQLGGNPIRHNTVKMKFDRVSGIREIGNQYFTETFPPSNGSQTQYPLTWVPIADKELITLTKNGILVLADAYTVTFTQNKYSPGNTTSYNKRYATLVLNFIPSIGDVIEMTYPKSLELYTAADRIFDYYKPTSGMPGVDLPQLMTGVEYPGVTMDTLPFNFSGGYDTLPFESTSWDNNAIEDGYASFTTATTSTMSLNIPYVISSGTEVNVYIKGTNDPDPAGVRIDSTSTTSQVATLIGIGSGVVDRIEMLVPGVGYIQEYTSVYISAPNTLNGKLAEIAYTVIDGAISIDVIDSGSGYTSEPIITIVESLTSSHSTSTVRVAAVARAIIKSEFLEYGITTSTVEIPTAAFTATITSPEYYVVFRSSTSDGTTIPTDLDSLDAAVSGGDIGYTTALGLSPSEIIVDGDGFLTPFNSYAPEECVPGQIQESVAINVYTQPSTATSIIVNKKYWVDGTTLTYNLGARPANQNSVIVLFNNVKLDISNFVIDYNANTITFTNVHPRTGWLSLTTLMLGTEKLLDYRVITTTASVTTFVSAVRYADIGNNGTSSYVTVNGVPAVLGTDYTISNNDSRAEFNINGQGIIQTYLFGGDIKSFSEVNEQIIIASSSTSVFDLISPPGKVGPFHSQVIVTKNSLRLTPPITTYYAVSNNQLAFDISGSITFIKRRIDLKHLEVYINGVSIVVSSGIWRYDQLNSQVVFANGTVSNGDVIAIVVKHNPDYLIVNNQLLLSKAVSINDEIHITTFTNHNPEFIRTDRFDGHYTNEYVMDRPIFNSDYVWASYNGKPLTAGMDYSVSSDNHTVIIRDGLYNSIDDVVLITSFADTTAKQLTGYKIFRDMLGRTHYKRLSAPNSTELAQYLSLGDATITVKDSSVLTPGNPSRNIPGVVFIDKERIEFFTINGNELGQLRRGTLGTAPKDIYVVGTQVVDQGTMQTIPFKETVQSTSTYTTSTTINSYPMLDGYITFNAGIDYYNQVEVRYNGKVLLKQSTATTYIHDFNASYDSTSTEVLVDYQTDYQFSIPDVNTIVLNTATVNLIKGGRLEVIKRTSHIWYNSTSSILTLADSSTAPALFISEKSAELPIIPSTTTFSNATLFIETGEVLTDEYGNPLIGE